MELYKKTYTAEEKSIEDLKTGESEVFEEEKINHQIIETTKDKTH